MVFLVSKTTTTLVSSQVQLYHNNNKRPQSMPFDRESLKCQNPNFFLRILLTHYRDTIDHKNPVGRIDTLIPSEGNKEFITHQKPFLESITTQIQPTK